MLANGNIVSHRRDGKAPTNKFHHGVPSGYPTSGTDTRNPYEIAVRESCEEHIFVTRDAPHRLLEPKNPFAKHQTRKTAEKLGIDTENSVSVDVSYSEGPDSIEICDEAGEVMKRVFGHVSFAWDSETALNYYMSLK